MVSVSVQLVGGGGSKLGMKADGWNEQRTGFPSWFLSANVHRSSNSHCPLTFLNIVGVGSVWPPSSRPVASTTTQEHKKETTRLNSHYNGKIYFFNSSLGKSTNFLLRRAHMSISRTCFCRASSPTWFVIFAKGCLSRQSHSSNSKIGKVERIYRCDEQDSTSRYLIGNERCPSLLLTISTGYQHPKHEH